MVECSYVFVYLCTEGDLADGLADEARCLGLLADQEVEPAFQDVEPALAPLRPPFVPVKSPNQALIETVAASWVSETTGSEARCLGCWLAGWIACWLAGCLLTEM